MVLKTERLNLKEVALSDLENIHQLHSLPETDHYNTLGIPNNIEETKHLVSEWLASQNELPKKRYVFCIENKDKEFIGLIGLNIGKPGYKSAETWYKLHSQKWNKGYATEAVKGILNFCFNELNLHRVEAGCTTNNIASIKVLEKCGFIKARFKKKKTSDKRRMV